MMRYRSFNRFVMLFGVALLSLAMLCAQGTRLHVHFVDCGQPSSMGLAPIHVNELHHQHAQVHLVTQAAQRMHASDGLSVLDLSPDGLPSKFSWSQLLLAVFGLLILRLPALIRQCFPRRAQRRSLSYCHYSFSPPLRAPPAN